MNLIKKIETEKVFWADISKPNEETLDFLKKIYYFHPFLLKNIVPPLRHPRFENYGEYLFIVFHYFNLPLRGEIFSLRHLHKSDNHK